MVASYELTQAAFLAILPRIALHARFTFRHLNPSDREEAAAETVAHAWAAFVRLRARGKDPSQFPATLARFSALAVRNGRRVGGRMASRDVMSGRRISRVAIGRYREGSPEDGIPTTTELLPPATRSRVPDAAALRVDFPAWLGRLTARRRLAALMLATGYGTGEVAAGLRVTAGRVAQLRNELAVNWHRFHAGTSRVPAGTK